MEELREELSNLMADLMLQTKLIQLGDDKSILRQGRNFINTHNKRLDKIMQLIASHIAKEVKEAQIKTIAKILVQDASGKKRIGLNRRKVIFRLAALQAKREENRLKNFKDKTRRGDSDE